ncbi:bifunctional phosphopantothenoylcysteine decarboxylase/phosphopantothenate--cysteine ligase CoaBC [Epilithonimonas hominis]|uniref:bifunctional phosphopantothenoylcysteine decarboxylase/phosphopantothenate--cysteine ligase CoaBC n=1 Tax=Epilithonimonas hominis TaxID=420404 RepID=UPI000ED25720|nr:bifunctional phosphopantothenoylcysteine decarboxylase/phosphopantothenate--cysteine ligase CoaBC [Epilithonimonas hominis]HAP94168.1 bifunctional phosphopantothenoylcysteine decarboxylase/phosphopantothenate--cysteine ligase CoaBC [Chryseobacterium sp.]
MSLENKKIIMGITGGIAAYKINYLVRDFVKAGAEVRIVMTKPTEDFVSPLTLSTLSRNKVYTDFYDENKTWNNHVELALWADVMLIAPCTANTLAKIANGICDNFLMAVYMSAKCPVIIAPAMDLDMYAHPAVTKNLNIIESFGHKIIPAEYGELASGLIGQGRLAEPETIFRTVGNEFTDTDAAFAGKKILITAGPTYENIDPVRFIGNHSSGKMGFDLAKEAAKRGAEVTLISGPSSQKTDDKNIDVYRVTSAQEMFDEVFKHYENTDIAIMSAAVADYTPKVKATEKIKKNEQELTIELIKNKDILRTMGEKKTHQFLVGFALETQNEEENAKGKLVKKNLDMIVLNSLRDEGAGFANATNKIKIFTPTEAQSFTLKSKEEVARDILNFIAQKL